ncbi:MAG: putative bifunctional diguanylate cyclase/phosphodiesterase [Rhizobiaceae bacterium]
MNDDMMIRRGAGSVYRSLVHSLFIDSKVLILGIVANTCGITLSAWVTGHASIFLIAAFLLLMGVARLVLLNAFQKAGAQRSINANECVFWERWFTVGAVAYTGALGIWCLAANVYDDAFLKIAATSVTFANVAGVVGRSYPLKRLVDLQLVTIAVFVLSGFLWSGGYYSYLGILLLPFIAGLSSIATWQRNTLLGNIIERRKAEKLATQFHTTLNNVPQGICMFDANGQIEVANRHILKVLDRSWKQISGATVSDLINHLQLNRGLQLVDAQKFQKWEAHCMEAPFALTFKLGRKQRSSFRFIATPMENSGLVITLDNITKEIEAENQIDYMTRFDRLTGLMNRDRLTIHVSQQLEDCSAHESCAVILFNLHRFKLVNDVYGHHVGDELLCKVAARLKALVGSLGQCARFGGDEFAVVVKAVDAEDLTRQLADQLTEQIGESVKAGSRWHQISCSVGVAFAKGGDGKSTEDLLKQADLALLWAREDGGGTWQQFNLKMMKDIEEQQQLEDDLRNAVTNGDFDLHYQPIADLNGKGVVVCEALMRWDHETRGMIPPSTFIPIAENLGLISEMGAWLLKKACLDCAPWPQHVSVAVNLSPLQFRHGDIDQHVFDALRESGLAPERLELEITESSMLDDMDEAIAKLHAFKKTGVSVALDDFGTGYSSLSYMSRLPIDKLKIDRSFVSDMAQDEQSLTLMKAIVQMGHFLGLTVVAEGVETFAELNMLRRHAPVDLVQGYLFSKPVPLANLGPLLKPDCTELKQMRNVTDAPKSQVA